MAYAYAAILSALSILSVKTLLVLRGAAPWTSAGWFFTIAYDCGATYEIVAGRHLALHAPYACLAALAVSFAVAGVRDEPQADPWWWPRRLALTRAQRSASR